MTARQSAATDRGLRLIARGVPLRMRNIRSAPTYDQAIDAFNDAAADGAVIGLEIDGSISVMRPTPH